jgi:hypothetical protein
MLMHPVPFVVIGILLFRFGRKQIYKVVGILVAILAAFFFFIAAASLVPNLVSLRHAYRSGDSSVVIGTVENLHPAPHLGPANESFSVKEAIFSYSVLDPIPCFHNAPAYNGPIRPGLEIRIYYKSGCIQRVDVRH